MLIHVHVIAVISNKSMHTQGDNDHTYLKAILHVHVSNMTLLSQIANRRYQQVHLHTHVRTLYAIWQTR